MLFAVVVLGAGVGVIAVAVGRFRLPSFLAISAVALAYGFAVGMSANGLGRAFGQGFASALEKLGFLAVVGVLLASLLGRRSLPGPVALGFGILGGLGGSAGAGLALSQAVVPDAPRRAAALALAILVVHALALPSPLPTAAASVLSADFSRTLAVALPAAAVALAAALAMLARTMPRDTREGAYLGFGLIAVAVPVALLIVQALAQIPSEPLGRGAARDFYTALARPLLLSALALGLAFAITRRLQADRLAVTGWALPLLAIGASGGLGRIIDATGVAELTAEALLDPRLGLAAPFLAAAVVKTLQGNSLTAVLTASGMVEPLLPGLGLDSAIGRALAAAAVGAGSMAICHVNDPFFWIAAGMARLTPARALLVLSLGSLLAALAALATLAILARMLA